MKTITFYSYKGGVGRSLALSNIAKRLSELNKKVCIVDFDVDAPGLQFKFNDGYYTPFIEKGLIDYISEYCSTGHIPQSILSYSTKLKSVNKNFADINLIPAGDIYNTDYWKKLSMISWSDMFYSENATGISFFLDLKHKIETELQPDFLFIDSRTGITDISGITLRLFADEVVILAVNNEENLFGSKMIIRNLMNEKSALFGVLPKINFVLTRLPFIDSPTDKAKKIGILNNLKSDFKEDLNLDNFDIHVIHSDRRLEEQERQLIGYSLEEKAVSISNDYLKLFKLLTADHLSDDELSRLEKVKKAEIEYSKFLGETQLTKKLEYINNAIELDASNPNYIFSRAFINGELGKYREAISDYLDMSKLVPRNSDYARYSNNNLAVSYLKLGEFETALNYVNEEISSNPDETSIYAYRIKASILRNQGYMEKSKEILDKVLDDFKYQDGEIYNSRANYYLQKGMLQSAYNDIFKAIELGPNRPIFLATLAEIKEADGKIDDFYLNLMLALSNGLGLSELQSTKEIYLKYEKDRKMIELLSKYNIDIESIKSA